MQQPVFRFEWVERKSAGRDFSSMLSKIEQEFQNECKLGTDDYWMNFRRNLSITRLLLMYEDREWTGFVAIKEGYQCFPDRVPGSGVCSGGHASWYIELICAKSSNTVKGRGSAMIGEVTRKAIEQGQEYVTLSALPYVIMWYYGLGFRLTMDTSCAEPAALTELAASIRQAKARFANDNEAFSNPEFLNFLRTAVTFGLGSRRMRSENLLPVGCNTLEECAVDGIYMTLCLPKKTMELSPWHSLPVPKEFVPYDMDWKSE
jgi:hypothetical protein